jgi:hypothetical protein
VPYEFRRSSLERRQWWLHRDRREMAELVEAIAAASVAVDRLCHSKRVWCDGCGAEWCDLGERWSLHRAEDEDGLELVLFCPRCIAAEFGRGRDEVAPQSTEKSLLRA